MTRQRMLSPGRPAIARLALAGLLVATQLPLAASAAPPQPAASAASAPAHRESPYAALARAHAQAQAQAASGASPRVAPLSMHKAHRPKSGSGSPA